MSISYHQLDASCCTSSPVLFHLPGTALHRLHSQISYRCRASPAESLRLFFEADPLEVPASSAGLLPFPALETPGVAMFCC